jgi:hypothetical protein
MFGIETKVIVAGILLPIAFLYISMYLASK